MGILWFLMFAADFIIDTVSWFMFFKLLFCIFFVFQYVYGTRNGYFQITENTIKLYQIPLKEIKIEDIISIDKIFDEYKIKSVTTTIKISTQALDKNYKNLFEEKIQEIRNKLY